MGIVCSGPSKNFITATMNGENGAFTEDIAVRVSDEGFCPSKLVLHKGQCILFEWNVQEPSLGVNIIQVSGTELNCVPGGYNSGSLAYSGSFKVCLRRKGQFNFVSGSFTDKLKTLKVQVLEKPVTKIKINDGRFEQQFLSIQEGDTVQWSCENGVAETPCYVQEMEYCFKHGGFISRKSRFEVKSACERTFHNTGLYYFHLENYDADRADDDVISSVCVVKVTQTDREFLVHMSEEGLQPNLISARVQDRIWLECPSSRIHGSKSLDAYIYKDSLASPLVTAKLSGSSRIAELVSYQFTEQGLYHYIYIMADLSQLHGCVVVQPRPKEHVIKISDGQYQPSLGTVFQGERVWWTQHQCEQSFILKELGCCTPAKGLPVRRKSLSTGCGCKKVKDQESIMSQLGVATYKFDEIGEFTYCLLLQGDRDTVSQSHCCSVVVQRTAKHHTIKVNDQGFTPRILNVHPGDCVWWQWEGTKRRHNIVQVSHQHISMPGGFYSGKPTCSASAFTNVFREFGVFYFASNGLPEVFGAVVVTPESQVHKVHVTVQGIQPDPLVVSTNDFVSWVWLDGESFSVQEILQPDHDVGETVVHPSEDACKRCYSQVLRKPGMHNFLCTAHHKDKSEVYSQGTDSFIHSVLVDPVSYSCMVGVTAVGFKPSTITVAKSQSVLWSWENQGDEEHNILHVRPPQDQQPLARVRGLSAFDSGPKTTRSTFFHTFDVPGRYFITSEGTDEQLCIVDVLETAAYVSPPKISAAEGNGGNVECGYRVFLECATVDAEIFYTTNGSYPADCNAELLQYKKKTGIVLAKAGFTVVRAIAKKNGWVTSPVYTSKRFWVVEGDKIRQEESGYEEDGQYLETGSEEVDLKEEIFKWHWLSCRPNITMELVCDNTFNIDVTLGNAADFTWIKGFQLFLNGTPYGGWFSPHCRSLVVSGLIGGKVYHVVLVVFATHDSFEPQLSNEVVISCPLQASSGGPLVSLEAATTPQSLVIVWPACGYPAEVTAYSVFIKGQPFGEQIIPEADSDYCRVLFESSLQHEVYTLCVASHLSESDVLLYSNEVEFTLPVPEEILSALHKPKGDEDSVGGDDLEDGGVPARELLLVAERVMPESSITEQSGIEKLSLKSVVSKLQTIPEDQQLDIMVAEADAENMENVPSTENGDTEAEPPEQQSGLELSDRLEEQTDATVVDEHIPVAENEAGLQDTPHDASILDESLLEDHANSELVVELDANIFRNRGESVSAKDTNLEPLVEETEAEETGTRLLGRDVGEGELGEHSDIEREIVDNERNDDDTLDLHENQGNGSSKEVPDQNGITYQAANENAKTEVESKLDNETETFGMERISEQSDSDFWDHGEKQHEEGTAREETVTPAEHNDVNDYAPSHASGQNDVAYHESKHVTDFQEHLDIKTGDTDERKEHDEQEVCYSEGLEQATYSGNTHEDEARDNDVGLDTNDDELLTELISKRNEKEHNSPGKDHNNSELEEASNLGNNAGGDDDTSAVNLESSETWQKDATVSEQNAKLGVGATDAAEPTESREYREECYNKSDDPELTGAKVEKLDEEVERGLESEEPLKKILKGAEELLQEPPSNISLVENQDISLPKEDEEGEDRNNKRFRENSKNVNSGENQTMVKQELKSEHFTSDQVHNTGDLTKESCETKSTAKGSKQTCNEVSKDTWSASSNLGSVKNEDDDNKDEMETTEMPTFEEAAFEVRVLSSHVNIEDNDGLQQVDKENEISYNKRNEERPRGGDNLQGLGTSHEDLPQDASGKLLPRPLLVIKGTTPTSVTLEWEWTLLPEQIAGVDILYSVLILGSKFHSNINSSFCYSFEESPAKTMWPKQNTSLKQHSWRTTNTVIEITGLKQRCSYRLAVLGQLMPCANDCLSRVISFTMPGPPKPPLIHVTDLKDREVTLTWKPPASFGEATVVGYRLLNDGKAFREDIDCETFSLSLNGLEEDKYYSLSLLAQTGHSVGDSKPSNTVIVYSPTPPTSPQIYPRESTAAGSISIAWKHEEPASADNITPHAHCSYSVFIDDTLYGECLLAGLTDIFEEEHTYTVPNCEVGRKYRVCVKSYLNPRVIDSGVDSTVYVCGCYGGSSNVLEMYCAGPPSPPNIRVCWIDQSGVTLSWSRSREFGGVTLAGYILHVNGKWSGELLPPEQQETKLTGFNPGDVIRVQMAAVTGDLGVPISDVVNQEGNSSRCFPPAYELPDSGVESSSSFLSKRSADETKQFSRSVGPPLVIQFSNFVKKVSSLEVINVGCRSALITWSLDDTTDRSVEPEVLSLSCWKATEQQESAVKHTVREKPFRIKDLGPGLEYCVMLECFASHVNDDKSSEQPINRTQSQSISFKTGLAPGPTRNIYVISATKQSIKLAWESPEQHGVPAMMIQLNARKTDENVSDKGANVQVSPDTCVFNFECLAARTEYTFTLKVLTEEELLEMTEVIAGSIASFSAWTNGVEPADKLNIESRTPTSLVIKWQPAVAYGMSTIQHYVVHYVQNKQLRKRSRGRVGQVKEAGKELIVGPERCYAELCGLEPGTVYRIIVQTVEGMTDYSYDEDFESEDSDTNSTISSAPNEKPPEVQQMHLSGPLLICTAAPPEPPVLLVRKFTATQIELSWNRPLVLEPVVDSRSAVGEDPARGRVRHLKGFRVEVNGRVYARLAANKTNITLKKCKSGMKYTCVVLVMTCPEKSDGHQRKSETLDATVSDTDTDEDNKSLSDCFEESASDPVEVTLPRQDWGVSLSASYCENKPAGSLRDSPCSESGEDEGGVEVRWKMTELAGDVSGYRLVWYNSKRKDRNEAFLPGDANGYEIWSVSVSALYTFYLEILDIREEAVTVFGPVHCQTPGPPSSPWIWCRTLSSYQITIEWNEPVTYGNVTIRGYQVYLNDRRLEKLVDRRQRRVNIHCQSSSVYRVYLVALGSDPQHGDSPPSNVLTLCTPVVQDSTMGRLPSGGIKRPPFDVTVNVLSTSNTSISIEWTHPAEIDTADHYLIKWSSVLRPQVQELTLPLIQTCHLIDDCSPGTSHFVVVAAVNAAGGLVARSQQYTVQTSAPVKQPALRLRACLQSGITIEWRKPAKFGDAGIAYYQLMVNSETETELDVECGHYMFTDCQPCQQYTFLLKAISTKAACDSDWSNPLVVTCPGAENPLITRIPSQQVNCIRVGWETPLLKGRAKVESYKVYYQEDKGNMVTSQDIIKDAQSIQHGPLPRDIEEDKLMHVPPDSYYWVMLQVELSPEGCQSVCSEPIRTRAAVSPDPPVISLEVEGLDERRGLEERICELSNKRDRLHRILHLLENSVVVKGSKQKDLQIAKATDTILEIDSELADALQDIKGYTGSISTLVRWSRPRDDGDAVVNGYQVFVDGIRCGKILPQWTLETHVKLSVAGHVIAVQTLTDHPVGSSPLSNAIELSGHEFLPFVLFCYFDVHKRNESWPNSGCCSWDDSHSYELKHRSRTSGRVFIPRGILVHRIPCPVFSVMDVFNALWRPVAPIGNNKMVAVLFWTKWCFSSQKVMEHFLQFAEEFMDKFSFVTCCVRSEGPVTSHRQSLANILTERGWRRTNDCVTHTCGCYSQSQRTRSARRGLISDPDVCQLFGLVGAPTLILLDSSGYISWQGRCSCQNASSFRTFLLHAFSRVSGSPCPVSSCTDCELDKEDDEDASTAEVDESVKNSSNPHRRESVELSSLHQRLHGPKPDGNDLTSRRALRPQGLKKELTRPKTTAAASRYAKFPGYNRFSGFNEPFRTYSRSFNAYGAIQPRRPDTAGPGSVSVRSRTRTPQTSTEFPSGDFSLPVVTQQRGKRAHPLERGSAPRIKTKISVQDFNILQK